MIKQKLIGVKQIMKNIIEVKNLTKEYKKVKAIDNLSFEVREGEILGLLRTEWKR